MNGYREATTDFIQSAKAVTGAIDILKTAIAGGDADDIDFAADIVLKSTDSYRSNTTKQGQFGFDEIAATPDTALPQRERMASDILAGALLDLQVANAVMIAGQAADKPDQPALVSDLDAAIGELNRLTNIVGLPLGKPVAVPAQTARFGFDEVAPATPTPRSVTLATAKANFETHITACLDTLVGESKKVVQAGFTEVKGIDKEKIAEAVGMLGKTALELPQVGKLITKGFALVIQAMDKLAKLLKSENVAALREKAQEILGYIHESVDLLDEFLRYSYGVTGAKVQVQKLLDGTSAQIEAIDAGACKLAELQTRFAEQMALVSRIVGGLSTGKRIAGFFLPEVTTVPLFGAFHILAINYAVLAGMDFADSASLLNLVDGVMKISQTTLS